MQENKNAEMQVTTFDDLKTYASNTVVRFPDFGVGRPFVAEVKRVSMMVLAKSGKIPNALLGAAQGLFVEKQKEKKVDANHIGEMYEICRVMAEAVLVKPSLKEIDESGVELTDEQLLAIFNFSQRGVQALEPFRKKQEDNELIGNV